MKTFAIKTLGCKVNTYESEIMKASFIAQDYREVNFSDVADVYIINTCTVTNAADSKSRKEIRRANKVNPKAILCVVGCYSQLKPEEVAAIEGVDIILGSKFKTDLVNLVNNHDKQKIIVEDILKDKDFEEMALETYTERTRAFIKIQDGCNKFCTYCTIPYARGTMRSKPKEIIIEEVKKLVNNGFKEIVLTGIHTGGYGEEDESNSFYQLIKLINEVEGLRRIRISSIEINQLTDEVIELMKSSDKFVNHLHIPIQSGSQTILERMRRHYSLQDYKDRIKKLKEAIVDLNVSTDLIVAFPEETEEEHAETLNTLREIEFASVHVFPYSKRDGTPAAAMKQINGAIADARVREVMDLQADIKLKYESDYIGKEVDVLFETRKDDYLIGHTPNFLKVWVKTDKDYENEIKKITIKSVNKVWIEGEL